jgi:DNA-binding IclR family transcriptional regulator
VLKEGLAGQTEPFPHRQANDEPEGKYFSKVVGKALNLLELIARSSRPLRLHELTEEADLPKSSVFRILYTLEAAGYILRDESGGYRVAAEARPWVESSFVKDLVGVATPRMAALRRRLHETVSLSVLFDNHIETVAVLESPRLIRMVNTVGRIIPPHASSMGKAITAFQPEDRRETLLGSYGLHRFTKHTIVDEDELSRELDRIRERGWSEDAEESADEGRCFGAPIFVRGDARAALSVSIPQTRVPEGEARSEMIRFILETASAVSREISDL